ncbi:MAG: ATP-binding protein [Chlorobium sp.]|jgi:predicted HTH transcriptional regulator|uniref:AlbA family DNA-binding domain-containing protein n=1 Tax=Chlorobium sp. TaxID=1095 RepID=UPI001D8EF5EA|nr:ATP-binding protein [Chlorobium sp.]MBN1279182.1 ATP-binding protein [Chlorobiaceae bacterium]MCF8216387.1 ATP-binding protein [Chlorobium sp.]MCF8271290.1 ATP-binding protein [Chlorobium sp.]MCF8287664.1 ATP-binding protein [Chlorobium sp.]MCF8291209.1 ATP-binding protein [Chlorobium sp.]
MDPLRTRFQRLSLLELVGQGENEQTEFKRLVHSPSKIAKPITAFANSRGGIILIGVDDDKRIVGIHSEKETLEILDEAIRFHIDPEPEIDFYVEEFKRRLVLIVLIPESPDKPHYHLEHTTNAPARKNVMEKRVYTREGSRNKALCDDRISLMLSNRKPITISFGTREKKLFGYLQEYRKITAEDYGTMAGIPLESARGTLVALVRSGALLLKTEGRRTWYTLPD